MPRPNITSAQSFATFKQWAFPVLVASANRSVRTKRRRIYDQCYAAAAQKIELRGAEKWMAMLSLSQGVVNHRVSIQGHGEMNVGGCATEYRMVLGMNGVELSEQAQLAARRYLHVYPADGRVEANNWRVAANVMPQDIPEIARRMTRVEDQFANAGHFKVTPPGTAGKPDSMILYMQKDGAYDATRNATLAALNGLSIQEVFTPMWNELAPGVAVGAEPPKIEDNNNAANTSGSSFGTFRCLLTVMAFNDALANNAGGNAGNLTFQDFSDMVDTYFDRYGVPHGTPHDQYQLVIGVAPMVPAPRTAYLTQQQWDDYLTAYALNEGVAGNTYNGWVIQNRPAIV